MIVPTLEAKELIMPFKVVTTTTVVHTGQPDPDGSLFTIHLEDGRALVGTDIWPHYPRYQLAIHPEYYPEEISQLIDEAVTAERQRITYCESARETTDYTLEEEKSHVTRTAFAAVISKDLEVGAPVRVIICHSYTGSVHAERTYPNVVRLEGTAEPAVLQPAGK